MGGIGKTTLANAVYEEVSPKFECRLFLKDVSEKIKKQGDESLRNELLSKLLDEKEICIDTPFISYPYQDRLNNKKVLLVLDDVRDPDQIDFMGVKYFGTGSKIIVTSRDRQVLRNGRANHIHEVKKLNKKDSLQLFSTFAFKLLNPVVDFQDLSCKFVEYAQGSPLALKVLGSNLYTKSKKEWESEVDKLKQYVEPKISQILKSSLDGLGEPEKNIFLDVACFFKGEKMDIVEKILSNYYMGAMCGIRNLADKCLLDSIDGYHISMHDMLEEIGKDIVRQKCKENPGKCSRLWFPEDVDQVLRYNQGTVSIEGIKLDMSQIDEQQLCPYVFENMFNLRYIYFYKPEIGKEDWNPKLLANQVDSVSLPNKLRYLCWDYFPFKSLSSFNPKNLIVLKLRYGNMEKLWNEDDHMDLVNLREINVSNCKNLRKIPNLSGAINLELLHCSNCESLVQFWGEDNHMDLVNLKEIDISNCKNLRKIPNLSRAINLELLNCFKCKSLVQLGNEDDYMDLVNLRKIDISYCENLRKIPSLLGAIDLNFLNCSRCESLVELPCLNHLTSFRQDKLRLFGCYSLKKLPQVPSHFHHLNLSSTKIREVPDSIEHLHKLQRLSLSKSKVKRVSINISKLEFLHQLDLSDCPMIKFPEIPRSLTELNLSGTQIEEVSLPFDSLCNLRNLNMKGSRVKNVSIKLESLRQLDLSDCPMIKFPEIPGSLTELNLSGTQIEEVFLPFDSLSNLRNLNMRGSRVKNVSIKLESLRKLNLSNCPMIKFPEIPRSLIELNLSGTQIEEVSLPLDSLCNLRDLDMSGSAVKNVSTKLESLRYLDLSGCPMVEFPEIPRITWDSNPRSILFFPNFGSRKHEHSSSLLPVSNMSKTDTSWIRPDMYATCWNTSKKRSDTVMTRVSKNRYVIDAKKVDDHVLNEYRMFVSIFGLSGGHK
ncbi:disease resistance protein RPV1 [Gossypium hirsutum]|uniref:Disease resistance protein RPV1 n=1 Tax=Gossypium hirsutum TaxID=3635 RepID=A0ABM2YUX4_GOSHI|nr:disease resistance protein RPV1-like [Gossypium hirsutum]XP_040934292.1 disease resistance protein RPV1-like [Gossypium hirsutum]